MLKYEFETVEASLSGWGLGGGNAYSMEGHREIILRRAVAGWRYAGYIPTLQRGTGHVQEVDLVFEKEE